MKRLLRVLSVLLTLCVSMFLAGGIAVALDAYEPDDTVEYATSIAVNGTMQEHDIDPSGDTDWVSFTVRSGCNYAVETTGPATILPGVGDTVLNVVRPDGPPLNNDDWTAPPPTGFTFYSHVDFVSTVNGTAFAEASAWGGFGTGGYQINVIETDVTAPTTTDNAPPGWQNADVNVTLTATDNIPGSTTTSYTINGGATQTYAGPIPFTTAGAHSLVYWSVDSVGNTEAANTVAVLIDKQAPATTGTAPSGWVTGAPFLTLSATDDLAGVGVTFFRVDTGPTLIYSGAIPFVKDGTFDVEYWSVDAAGNAETSKTLQVQVDNTQPSVSDDAPSDWQSTPFDVTIDATDTISSIASIDITATLPPSSGVMTMTVPSDTATVPVTIDGTTTIEYTATDAAGNTSAPQVATALLDTTAPGIVIDADPAWCSTPVTVSIEASDTASGLDEVVYWLDGLGPIVYTGPFQVAMEGETTITAMANDIAGNSGIAVPAQVKIDYTPPVMSDDAPTGWQTADTIVTVEMTDTASGLGSNRIFYDNPPYFIYMWNSWMSPAPPTFSNPTSISWEGTTTLRYWAQDHVGNEATTQTTTILIDKTNPTTSIFHPMGWQSEDVPVTLAASDAISGADTTYYRLNGGTTRIYTGTFEIGDEGTTTVEFWSMDVAGNIEATQTSTVMLDYEAPGVTDDCPVGWQTSAFEVTIDAFDSVSGVASIDATITYPPPSGVMTMTVPSDVATVPITIDGTTTIEYTATDAAGNTSAPQSAIALLDTTAPGIVIDAPSAWSSTPVTVSIEASDTASGLDDVVYWLDGLGPIVYSAPFQVDIEGETTITAMAIDEAGNSAMAVPDVVKIDYTPPAMSDDVPSGWQTSDTLVTVDVSDSASGIGAATVIFDNPPDSAIGQLFATLPGWSPVPVQFSVSWEGTTTVTYWGNDFVGNAVATQTATLLIDKTPPTSAIYHPMGWQSTAVDVSIDASDNASGVDTTYYRLNGGTTYTYSAPFDVTAEGTTTIEYWSVDVAGHVEATQTSTVMVDYDAPRVMDDCPDYWVDSFFDVMIEIEDDISGPASIDITLTLPPPSGVMTMSVPSDVATIPITIDGTTTIEYTGTDVAGNTSEPQVCLALLDTIAPSIDVTASPDWSSVPVTVTVEASDTPSGVDYSEYRVDGGDAVVYVGPFAQALEGVHTVIGTAYDMAGNTSTDTVTTYNDYTPPVTTDDALDTYTGTADFTLTATDTPGADATDSSGVAYTQWRPAGGAWTTGTVVQAAGVGDHTIEYRSVDNAGNTEETRTVTFHIFADGSYGVIRIWGDDRFETGVETARTAFDPDHDGTWPGVDHVIVASGMGVLADPLPSAGLVWAYDSPLLLLNPARETPSAVAAIQEISASCGTTVTLHVVGGTQALPEARIAEIEAAVAGPLEIDRLRTDGDRFDMAATIAERVSDEWESRNGTGTAPERVLLANGYDQDAFFDALALSAVSASEGYPILLLKQDEVPAATDAALTSINPTETIVAGGPAAVSDSVVSGLGATRWWGADRYETAISVAENSVARGWLERKIVGISASLPDALADGGPLGRHNGVSLLTRADTLSAPTKLWLETYQPEVEDCFIFGGTAAVSPEVKAQIEDALKW